MYCCEKRMRAIELYIQHDRSSATVIRELGYPSRKAHYRWYREYKKSGGFHVGYQKRHKFSAEQKQIAVECGVPKAIQTFVLLPQNHRPNGPTVVPERRYSPRKYWPSPSLAASSVAGLRRSLVLVATPKGRDRLDRASEAVDRDAGRCRQRA